MDINLQTELDTLKMLYENVEPKWMFEKNKNNDIPVAILFDTTKWQVDIDDWLNTRFYFDGPSGLYHTVRNDAWVVYDTFWRLHIMDYGSGENFNNPLISAFSISALLFALSGIALGTQRLLRKRL